jgi:hypothetical protein
VLINEAQAALNEAIALAFVDRFRLVMGIAAELATASSIIAVLMIERRRFNA